MRLELPERHFGPVYEDNRWKDAHAFNIRHCDTMEILRYRTREEAQRAQTLFKRQGYRAFKQRSRKSKKSS